MSKRYRIEYADQNTDFEPLLPREGTILSRHTSSTGVNDWCLLKLDEPLQYRKDKSRGAIWSILDVDRFLIRSRWYGKPLDGKEPTSVFILLVQKGEKLQKENLDIDSFLHVAWGMAYKIDDANKSAHTTPAIAPR